MVIDGSTEFKCERRRSASFPDTAEMTSSTYRFQNKGWTGEEARGPLFHIFHYHVGNDSRNGRTHSRTKNLLVVGAIVCELSGVETKRQQIYEILHGQRSFLSQ